MDFCIFCGQECEVDEHECEDCQPDSGIYDWMRGATE